MVGLAFPCEGECQLALQLGDLLPETLAARGQLVRALVGLPRRFTAVIAFRLECEDGGVGHVVAPRRLAAVCPSGELGSYSVRITHIRLPAASCT